MLDDTLTSEELISLKKLAFAGSNFEPFASAVIRDSTLSRLVYLGVVETGPSCRPAVGSTGYRLGAEGWRMARTHWHKPAPTALAG